MASYTVHSSWLGRRDSNPRMSAPKTDALPLGDAPATELAKTRTGVIVYLLGNYFNSARQPLFQVLSWHLAGRCER